MKSVINYPQNFGNVRIQRKKQILKIEKKPFPVEKPPLKYARHSTIYRGDIGAARCLLEILLSYDLKYILSHFSCMIICFIIHIWKYELSRVTAKRVPCVWSESSKDDTVITVLQN